MGAPAHKTLTAKEAIDFAFAQFNEFYADKKLRNVLLEGLEFVAERDEWVVTIGFDLGREKTTGGELAFLDKTKTPIREARVVTLRATDGSFVRMTSA